VTLAATLVLLLAIALLTGDNRWPEKLGVGGSVHAMTTEPNAGSSTVSERPQDRAQIMLEARIVENQGDDYVDWSPEALRKASRGDLSQLFLSDLGPIDASAGIDAMLLDLERRGILEVLSAPRVMTLDRETAAIQSGTQVPVRTVTDGEATIQYVNATLRLQMQPHLRSDGSIELRVEIQKRYLLDQAGAISDGNSPIQTTEASSSMVVADGGTIALAGMNEQKGQGVDGGKRLVLFVTARVMTP
jgi:type II secretory pathway component GspD/PulD (secretin)